jgi:NADPH:quinone reductase-like Zn-dependent oxidoreductase
VKAWTITNNFGIDNLEVVQRPMPSPGKNEVLLKLKAASLNFRDYLMVTGKYNPRQKLPLVPLSDGAGEIIEIGDQVTSLKVGEKVACLFAPHWMNGSPDHNELRSTLGGPLDGTMQEFMILNERSVVRVPDYLDFREAATLPCAALTSWSSLVTYGNIKAGDSVLILGTGGVSIFALQIAKALGCHTILTSGSHEKLQKALELGADEVINYKENPNWGKEVMKRTSRRGVDHVIEVGGAGTIEQSITATKIDGCISLIGILAGNEKPINLLPMLMKNIKMQGIVVGHKSGLIDMLKAFEKHTILPVIDKHFGFDELPDALNYLVSGNHFGKITIDLA